MALVDMREQQTFLLELSGNARGVSPVVRRAEFLVVTHAIANDPPCALPTPSPQATGSPFRPLRRVFARSLWTVGLAAAGRISAVA
eukprot:1593987-Pyramimonas_sp.AAC.1